MEKILSKILTRLRTTIKLLAIPLLFLLTASVSAQSNSGSSDKFRPELKIEEKHYRNPDFRWDPIGLAELLAEIARPVCRYNDTNGTWLVYDGRVWREDKHGIRVARYAMDMTVYLQRHYDEIVIGLDDDTAEKIRKVIFGQLPTKKYRDNIIADTRAMLKITSEELNQDKNLFNVANGTINLITGELQPHNPDDYITRLSEVVYNPEAHSQFFLDFISEITCHDAELSEYIQMVLGYALSGETPLECLWIFCGFSTRNGKSTLLEAVRQVFGGTNGYVVSTSPATFVEKKFQDSGKASGDIARIEGYRLMIVAEPSMRMILDTALIKTMTGRDKMVARAIRESEREFYPEVKILMNTNFLPIVNDVSIFESYRMIVVPFYRHFNEDEIDPTVKTRLQTPEESSAILNWLLEGFKKARQGGLSHRPECVERETKRYRETSDYLMQFFNDRMKKCDKNCKAGDVFKAYEEWAAENDIQRLRKGEFFDDLRARKFMVETGTVAGKTIKNVVVGYKVAPKRKPRNK